MTDEEFENLKSDIVAQGLLEPIWLYEQAILDGIHRQCACAQLSVTPQYRQYHGSTPGPFVLAANIIRRHLSVGQQADTLSAMARYYRSKYPSQQNVAGADLAKVSQDLGLASVPKQLGTAPLSTVLLVASRAAHGNPTKTATLVRAVETYETLRKQTPELAKEVAAGTKALYVADDERKAAAKVPTERSGGDSEAESIEKDCQLYLAAIRTVAAIQTRLIEKRPKRKKEFLAGVQDKIERVASAGKRWMGTL